MKGEDHMKTHNNWKNQFLLSRYTAGTDLNAGKNYRDKKETTMLRRFIHFALMVAVVCSFIGCETGAFQKGTLMDNNWGKSYETARIQQILNPEAGKNLEPVEGLDGDSATQVLKNYHDSFGNKETKSTTTLDLVPVGVTK